MVFHEYECPLVLVRCSCEMSDMRALLRLRERDEGESRTARQCLFGPDSARHFGIAGFGSGSWRDTSVARIERLGNAGGRERADCRDGQPCTSGSGWAIERPNAASTIVGESPVVG
jgi:hypothetical protein